LDDVRTDRNHWRQIAERSLLTDQRSPSEQPTEARSQPADIQPVTAPPEGFWSRLLGRPMKVKPRE
jgi:hypothetical protein